MKYIVENKNLLILFISTFLFFMNESLLLPTLPIHLSSIGYTNIQIGIILGSFALGVLLFRPLSGYVTDQKSRKLALIIGVAIFFIVPYFYLVSEDLIFLVTVRFCHGLGITFYTTAMPTFVTDVAPVDQRGEILGHMASASTLSFACGPLLGVYIYSRFGFFGLIMTCILAGAVNFLVIVWIEEQYHSPCKKKQGGYRQLIFRRSIIVSACINLVDGVIFGTIMTFLPILLKETPDLNVGFFFLTASATIILCRIFTAHFIDRIGRGPAFVYSFFILIISIFLVSEIDTRVLLCFIGALFGCGSALCTPALSAFVADETQPDTRGAVFGFFNGAFDAGVILAGLIMGYVADLTSLRDMFVIMSLSGLACLVAFVMTIRDTVPGSIKWSLTGE